MNICGVQAVMLDDIFSSGKFKDLLGFKLPLNIILWFINSIWSFSQQSSDICLYLPEDIPI